MIGIDNEAMRVRWRDRTDKLATLVVPGPIDRTVPHADGYAAIMLTTALSDEALLAADGIERSKSPITAAAERTDTVWIIANAPAIEELFRRRFLEKAPEQVDDLMSFLETPGNTITIQGAEIIRSP